MASLLLAIVAFIVALVPLCNASGLSDVGFNKLPTRNGNRPGFCILRPDPRAKTRDPNRAQLLIVFFFFGA